MKFSLFTVMVPAWSPEEVVKKLKEYGYDGVEWRVRDVPKAAPDPMPARDQSVLAVQSRYAGHR